MRVVINGWFWDQPTIGSGQYVRQLAKHLLRVAPDWRVTVVTPHKTSCEKQANDLLHFAACPTSDLGKVWFEQVVFPRVCRELRADVAHVPYWGGPLRSSIPVVVSILDLIPLLLPDYRGGPLARLYTGLVTASAPGAAQIIAISHASKCDIVGRLRIPAERVHVTYLAADERFTPQANLADEAALRNRHPDLPQNYVLYLGGFDARKNIETLLQMCGWLQIAYGADVPLAIAGRLPPRHDRMFRDPRLLARQLHVEDLVRCIGAVDEQNKPALYRAASVFVYPSRYEGFGLPALEALACGVPVVGSNASAIPEVVGDAGILVDPDDAMRMAGGLIAVLNEDNLRRELGRRAAAQAARFSWEQCARQTAKAYAAALRI